MRYIRPLYVMGRYGWHEFIPFKNKWDGIDEEKLRPDQQEFMIPESYYRAIGDDYNFPESLDLDGGPFMTIGSTIEDYPYKYKIDKFDCCGKYPILICSKLQS